MGNVGTYRRAETENSRSGEGRRTRINIPATKNTKGISAYRNLKNSLSPTPDHERRDFLQTDKSGSKTNTIVHTAIIYLCLLVLPVSAGGEGLEKGLQKSLREAKAKISIAQAAIKKGLPVAKEIKKLKKIGGDIERIHMLLKERYKKRAEALIAEGREQGGKRHGIMTGAYLTAIERILSLIDDLHPETVDPRPVIDQLKKLLDGMLPEKKRPVFGSLPYRHMNYPARKPDESVSVVPAYRGGDKTITANDTAGTPLAPINNEIASLAQSLNWNPVLIYEYVKNTIETEWYWGCMKGAMETLRQKSGNDCDQATLLTALLRASGFPARYVRGTMEFFAGSGRPMERIKNLTGIDDPIRIADYFRKAGIPFEPVIQGGEIANFRIEHIWVESLIPYANYRGAIIDEHGKTWLGLDTGIKATGYEYNRPLDIYEQSALSGRLSAVRDEYLGSIQSLTPIEYLKNKVFEVSGLTADSYTLTRLLIPEHMNILPASMQFVQKHISHEYADIPDDLTHTVRFNAIDKNNNELLNIELSTFELSNKRIVISYEPETVEDQEIINSYGGLGNTPSYLVRLRPVIKVDGERVAVGVNGLPMGEDYALTIELIGPNGAETVDNTMITGNVTAMGIAAGRAVPGPEFGVQSEGKTAEDILHEEAMNYIDRWNKAEDELASFLHLTIARPIPTVVTIGGIVDVTYLLDTPHDFDWKGVYIDADLRSAEAVGDQPSANGGERVKTFMELSSLQGSILENRLFEDDFQVGSISTAKLFQIVSDPQSAISGRIITIDKTNIDTILPSLSLNGNIEEDIRNAVNQGLVVRLPQADSRPLTAVGYQDWTGTGYFKESPETGESGWMLSGMPVSSSPDLSGIAGGMTAWGLDRWPEYYRDRLIDPYSEPPNYDPASGASIHKITSTDLQQGEVGTRLEKALQVVVYDKEMRPVKDVEITFVVKAGGGILSDGTEEGTSVTIKTDTNGIASAYLTLGSHTKDNPTFWLEDGATHTQQVGENIVDVSLPSGIRITTPFTAYGFPGEPHHITKTHGDDLWSMVLTFAGFVALNVEDEYGNPIANVPVRFDVRSAAPNPDLPQCAGSGPDTRQALLVATDNPCIKNAPTYGECADAKTTLELATSGIGASAQVILGGIPGAVYPIAAAAGNLETVFNLYSYGIDDCDETDDPWGKLLMQHIYVADPYGSNINAGKTGAEIPVMTRMYYIREGESETEETLGCSGETLTCTKITGNGHYDVSTDFTDAAVSFSGVEGTDNGDGVYTAVYTLKPGKNTITVDGTADISTRRSVNTCSGCGVNDNYVITESSRTTMDVYGVDITVDPLPLLLVDDSGRMEQDYPIRYAINPAEYKAVTAYVVISKNDMTVVSIPGETQGNGVAVISGGFQFDISGTYDVEVILNFGTGVEIRSGKRPLPILHLRIVKPAKDEKILIKNDSSGQLQMPKLKVEAEVVGTNISQGLLDNVSVCWSGTVEYMVNTTAANYRSRKGLDCDDHGNCTGIDGFFTPEDCTSDPGVFQTTIDWGAGNLGGGILELTAKMTVNGIEVRDTYYGTIEGESFSDVFKNAIITYLENPDSDQTETTIREEVGYDKFFRVIAYLETRYRHFYPSIYGEPKGAIYPRENELGDGGYGIMQLTDPAPTYEQIWDYKHNIDGGVELLRSKLEKAKAYPEFVRITGCTTTPKTLPNGKTIYYCFPVQEKDKNATDFGTYQLRMDTYSLYNSAWHYWKWAVDDKGRRKWVQRHPQGRAPSGTGSYYADEAEKIEKNPPKDF